MPIQQQSSKFKGSLTEWQFDLDLSTIQRLADSVLIDGRNTERVIVMIDEILDGVSALRCRARNLTPVVTVTVTLLDDVPGDGSIPIMLWGIPSQLDRVLLELGVIQWSLGRKRRALEGKHNIRN